MVTEELKFKIRFCFRHPSMDMDEISVEMNLLPFVSWSVGTQRRTPRGRLLEGTHESGYWCSEAVVGGEDEYGDMLSSVLDRLECHRLFVDRLVDTGGRVEVIVAIFLGGRSGGPSFEWELLRRIAALRLHMSLDIYGGRVDQHNDQIPAGGGLLGESMVNGDVFDDGAK